MYLSSNHVQLIGILFNATLNLDSVSMYPFCKNAYVSLLYGFTTREGMNMMQNVGLIGLRRELMLLWTLTILLLQLTNISVKITNLYALTYLYSGAPNGSVPQNICSSCKFLLAGRFGQNNMSLETGKLWVSEVLAAERYVSETS